MKKLTIIFAATLFFAAPVSTALAEVSSCVALDVGQTKAKDICPIFGVPENCNDTSTLYRIAFGYHFARPLWTEIPAWGIEIGFGDYGKANWGTFPTTVGEASLVWQLDGMQVWGTGTFPLRDAFSLIGKLGIVRTDVKLTASTSSFASSQGTISTNLALGVATQYDITKSVAVRTSYHGA